MSKTKNLPNITFKWEEVPGARLTTFKLTCSNGMDATIAQIQIRPAIYLGDIHNNDGETTHRMEIHCNLRDSKKTIEERIIEFVSNRCVGIALKGTQCPRVAASPNTGLCRDCQNLVDTKTPFAYHKGKCRRYVQFTRLGQQPPETNL